ncbi:MAG: hypothetical protein ABGY75_13815, partial [Gemmataceae bacterium]
MLSNYTPYKNLPPLAGLCSIEDATKPGLPLDECVRRLKRFHYCFKRLHEILTARITSEPIYELKTAFAHHAYLCAEHVTALRQRVSEMREPPLGLEDVPHPALAIHFDEIQNAPSTQILVGGVMLAFGNLLSGIHQYRQLTHPLTDAPSRRLLKFAMSELSEITSFYARVMEALHCDMAEITDWGKHVLEVLLAHADWFDDQGLAELRLLPIPCRYSATPYTYDPIPQRDERFADLWNQGVNAEAFLYDETKPAQAKVLMMLFKRLREIDVPEMMAGIIAQTPGKPWGYYRDMSRQVWDEARHAMMGEVGFVALGVDWTKARITWNWSYRLNTECTPLERHGVLFFIEQGLMPRTGKRYEFEVASESGIP